MIVSEFSFLFVMSAVAFSILPPHAFLFSYFFFLNGHKDTGFACKTHSVLQMKNVLLLSKWLFFNWLLSFLIFWSLIGEHDF